MQAIVASGKNTESQDKEKQWENNGKYNGANKAFIVLGASGRDDAPIGPLWAHGSRGPAGSLK